MTSLLPFGRKGGALALMLCIGLLQIAGYYLAGALAKCDGPGIAVPQPDTLLYCQAARRIAEGHPFSFAEGEPPSTGTTSVAYPFVLAVPYALGARGGSLLVAGFAMNAAFYLLFLAGWSVVIRRWLERPEARLAAALLVALSGQAAFCAMAQSDAGLWMAAGAWLAAGLASGDLRLCAPLLVAGPWLRPEGMMCAVAYAAVAFFPLLRGKRPARREAAVALLALASAAGVFALNLALTGEAQFSSVAHKGHFAQQPFCLATVAFSSDVAKILKEVFLGIPLEQPREAYLLPVLGAAFLWLGVFQCGWLRPGRAGGRAAWWLAVALSVLSVASGGYQNTNADRYFAWFAPALLLFAAEGAAALGGRLPRAASALPAALLVAYALFSAAAMNALFGATSIRTDQARLFAAECDEIMPKGASVAISGYCGVAYEMPGRPVRNTSGTYSPRLFAPSPAGRLEILKRHPEWRPDYWFFLPQTDAAGVAPRLFDDVFGKPLAEGPGGHELRLARWDAFDRALAPPPAPEGMALAARLDVGYAPDEKEARYEIYHRYGLARREDDLPVVGVANLDGAPAADACRAIVGADSALVPLAPGRDAVVVMRTLPAIEEAGGGVKFALRESARLRIKVDGLDLGIAAFDCGTNGFRDVSFAIPGGAIRRTPCRVAFCGDHIAAGYWFYQ